MNNKQAKAEVNTRLLAGEPKQAVFDSMVQQGVKERKAAGMIASFAAPYLLKKYSNLRMGVLILAGIQILGAVAVTIFSIIEFGLPAGIVIGILTLALTGAFMWGFVRNKAITYNITILLTLAGSANLVKEIIANPTSGLISAAINIAIVGYIFYTRSKLFPDIVGFGPVKVKGQYVFNDAPQVNSVNITES